ncbi:MAG: hypothetical protein AAF368_03480, partial [Planctomycetota bacterium]
AIVDAGLLPLLQRLYEADVAAQEQARAASEALAAEQALKRRSRRGSTLSVKVGGSSTNELRAALQQGGPVAEDVKRFCGMALANIADDLPESR